MRFIGIMSTVIHKEEIIIYDEVREKHRYALDNPNKSNHDFFSNGFSRNGPLRVQHPDSKDVYLISRKLTTS
ncbi:hypothetical protein Y032_0118g741 [Ancylostoma ceylanicum]|uniref:Uncharacterized protein n=1 Tax=Ancylostoma ceylanicum TaxID=53326 RepID=A0A016TAU7_9BILA|nr:hypothetical protein Y032_0118g741 [Ancylostoma ceylanicum]